MYYVPGAQGTLCQNNLLEFHGYIIVKYKRNFLQYFFFLNEKIIWDKSKITAILIIIKKNQTRK